MFRAKHEASRVEEFLRHRFGEVRDIAPIGKGEWSQAFSFATGTRELVVRFGQFADDYAKDRTAFGFSSADLPIPEVHEIGEAFDGVYAISTRAHGRGFDELDAAGYRRALPAVFRALDALRRIDTSATRGYGMWRPDGTAPYASWREMLLDVGNPDQPERIRGWRPRLARDPAAVERFERASGFGSGA